ncbi:putative mediator of RNA polymerase II transcription subunit 26 [Scaptodrosophila lebanonensis]|uniref:Mediator of RNA polymerase II transcription subunit 26 n=1 Tax=Drosophila lebanonensis TaxID=7225 RepID=A0A6J2U746_DROLE|nr:putative mediator of RNA polymerase II transcription subunit 26 [Scaptodrosophila lebanonensis]
MKMLVRENDLGPHIPLVHQQIALLCAKNINRKAQAVPSYAAKQDVPVIVELQRMDEDVRYRYEVNLRNEESELKTQSFRLPVCPLHGEARQDAVVLYTGGKNVPVLSAPSCPKQVENDSHRMGADNDVKCSVSSDTARGTEKSLFVVQQAYHTVDEEAIRGSQPLSKHTIMSFEAPLVSMVAPEHIRVHFAKALQQHCRREMIKIDLMELTRLNVLSSSSSCHRRNELKSITGYKQINDLCVFNPKVHQNQDQRQQAPTSPPERKVPYLHLQPSYQNTANIKQQVYEYKPLPQFQYSGFEYMYNQYQQRQTHIEEQKQHQQQHFYQSVHTTYHHRQQSQIFQYRKQVQLQQHRRQYQPYPQPYPDRQERHRNVVGFKGSNNYLEQLHMLKELPELKYEEQFQRQRLRELTSFKESSTFLAPQLSYKSLPQLEYYNNHDMFKQQEFEQQQRDQQQQEQLKREQQGELELREQQIEWQQRELQRIEWYQQEQQQREQQQREQKQREQQQREQQQREQQQREQQQREQQQREKKQREQQLRERQQREQHQRERQQRERQRYIQQQQEKYGKLINFKEPGKLLKQLPNYRPVQHMEFYNSKYAPKQLQSQLQIKQQELSQPQGHHLDRKGSIKIYNNEYPRQSIDQSYQQFPIQSSLQRHNLQFQQQHQHSKSSLNFREASKLLERLPPYNTCPPVSHCDPNISVQQHEQQRPQHRNQQSHTPQRQEQQISRISMNLGDASKYLDRLPPYITFPQLNHYDFNISLKQNGLQQQQSQQESQSQENFTHTISFKESSALLERLPEYNPIRMIKKSESQNQQKLQQHYQQQRQQQHLVKLSQLQQKKSRPQQLLQQKPNTAMSSEPRRCLGQLSTNNSTLPQLEYYREETQTSSEELIIETLNTDEPQPMNYGDYPPELQTLFSWNFCNLCRTTMRTMHNAVDHYSSRSHDRRVSSWLVRHFCQQGQMSDDILKYLRTAGPAAFYCELCDLKLTSVMHAQQHFFGRRHRLVARHVTTPNGEGFYDSTGHWVRTDAKWLMCEICDVSITSETQMAMHVAGARHRKRLHTAYQNCGVVPVEGSHMYRINANGTLMPLNPLGFYLYATCSKSEIRKLNDLNAAYYCEVCNITLNHLKSVKQHEEGRMHRKKMDHFLVRVL